jgi:hypothetical protein
VAGSIGDAATRLKSVAGLDASFVPGVGAASGAAEHSRAGARVLGWFDGVELMHVQQAARSGLDALVLRFGKQLALLLLLRHIGLGLGLEADPIGEFPAVIGGNQIDAQAIDRREE